jgi:glycosyltransferase involved in cell wall biosynthesis
MDDPVEFSAARLSRHRVAETEPHASLSALSISPPDLSDAMHRQQADAADIRSIRIVARTNGVGMDRDVRLLRDAIAELGASPEFSRYRSISPLRRWFDRRDDEHCIIFLERVTARWLRRAGRYLLIPNQERYPERLVPLLRRIDHVLCKSHHAVEVFAARHPSVHYLGFTSEDRGMPATRPDYTRFLHLAGASNLKGTPTLLEVWSRHPEWPVLTLLMHRRDAPRHVPANVDLIADYLPDDRLRTLQNACGVHLCPSLSEGWGHYIVEAMSCRAVTITTDGPPMNELVSPDRGVLVPVARTEPRKLGTNFHVETDALEAAIEARLNASAEENARLGEAARAWYERNDRAFRERLASLIATLLPGATSHSI